VPTERHGQRIGRSAEGLDPLDGASQTLNTSFDFAQAGLRSGRFDRETQPKEDDMDGSIRKRLAAGGIAALAVAGGGAAVAATQGSPQVDSQAALADAAAQLGVSEEKLDDALRSALENRVDEAVKADRLSEEEGERLKDAIESGDVPLLGVPLGGRSHGLPGHHLGAAASYLGLSESDLRAELEDGETLADVAKAQDKSVDGLVDALVADEQAELDQAVEDGRLTETQRDELLAGAEGRMTDLVNGELPGPPDGRFGPGSGESTDGAAFDAAA
jgi:hypothetical protein